MSDRSLVDLFERFRLGDTDALGRVFDETAPGLQRIARHLVQDAAEAEDLVQATFLVAIEKRDSFDATRELGPWLTGILLKQASLARRARRRVVEPDRLDSRASEDPLDVAGARELSEALTVALAKLSAKDREVLLPLLLDGRRAVEIARELSSRPDTVHMRIHRGLARLRRLLPAGLALALMARIGGARGLGAVRTEVLRQAHAQVGFGSAAAIAAISGGLVMSLKHVVGIVAVIVLVLVGGFAIVTRVEDASAKSASVASAGLEAAGERSPSATESSLSPESTSVGRANAGALSSSNAATFALELEVTRGDGRPAKSALVAFVDATTIVSSARTDDAGLCRFSAQSGSADVYVRDDGSLPFHARIDITTGGRRKLELPAGREFSGRISLLRPEPGLDIELKLSTDSAPEGFSTAPLSVFETLELMLYTSKQVLARTKLDAGGLFRFHGLPEGWSGTLSLPKVFVFVDDELPTSVSERAFKSATTGLELTIAYRPRIIGRIIDSTTRTPIPSALLDCTLQWSDGNSVMTNARTDSEGRFTLAPDYRTDAVGLEIQDVMTAGGAVGRVQPIANWSGTCEPRDLGDIECTFPPGRSIEFHAVDPSGKALAGTRARIDRSDVIEANAEGVGVFSSVSFDAAEMRLVAPGHAIKSVILSRETVSPIVVTLAPTNRLTIALPPEHVGRQDLQAALLSTPLLFGGKSRMYDSRLHGDIIGFCSSADGDRGTRAGRVNFNFSESGLVEVEDVQSGVPFSIRLVGATSPVTFERLVLCEVRIESLGPTEQRRVEMTIERSVAKDLRVLRGRVVDEQGRPLLGAHIGRFVPDRQLWAITDFDGRFRVDFAEPALVDIEVSKRGYAPFRTQWDVMSDKSLEARLVRGTDLRLELKDGRGRWIEEAKVKANIASFGPPSEIESGSTGVFTLQDLPEGTVDVSVIVAGKTYESSHATHAGIARITLPACGRLEVTWNPHTETPEMYAYQVAVRPTGSDGAEQVWGTIDPMTHHDHVFVNVLPGEYAVGLEVDPRNDDDENSNYIPLHPPTILTIVAGETKRVELKH